MNQYQVATVLPSHIRYISRSEASLYPTLLLNQIVGHKKNVLDTISANLTKREGFYSRELRSKHLFWDWVCLIEDYEKVAVKIGKYL